VRPLRFAVFVAVVSAICVLLGRLWVHSLDDGTQSTPVERVLRAGTGAVAVAIAGVDAQVARARARAAARHQLRAIDVGQRIRQRQSPADPAETQGAPVLVVAHAVNPKPVVHTATAAPTTAPKPQAKPSPAAKPNPAHSPTPRPKPTPKPPKKPKAPKSPKPPATPTPQPPAPPEPAPAPTQPTAPEPTPPPPPTPEPPDVAPAPSQPAPEPPGTNEPTPPTEPPSGGDSRPGWGHGDDNHDHTGPPGHIGDWDHGHHNGRGDDGSRSDDD
jgi:hypothetical protein